MYIDAFLYIKTFMGGARLYIDMRATNYIHARPYNYIGAHVNNEARTSI